MSKINLTKLGIESAAKYVDNANRRGKYSIGLTYSTNGTRVTLSNALYSSLELKDRVYVGIATNEGGVVFSKQKVKGLEECKISGKSNAIYNATLVKGIVNAFELNEFYETHSSQSFHNIEIDEEQGVALVYIDTDVDDEEDESEEYDEAEEYEEEERW